MWLQVSAVTMARMGASGKREYLVVWKFETEEGELEETWEPYHHFLMVTENGEMAIHPETEKQVSATRMHLQMATTPHMCQCCGDLMACCLCRLGAVRCYVMLFWQCAHTYTRR